MEDDDFDLIDYVNGKLFDHALLFGMSADEYWFGDPSLIYSYQNAFNLRQQYDLQLAWTQGVYFKSALGSTLVWATLPAKSNDLKNMPKYAEDPTEYFKPKKKVSAEKLKLIEETKARLTALGLLRKDK